MHQFLILPVFPAVPWLLVLFGSVGAAIKVLYDLFKNGIKPKEAKSIAIFGSKGSGKTTLWKQLMGEFKDKDYIPTLGVEHLDEFPIEFNGKRKVIKKSADFGGDDKLVHRYGEIIEDKTFIYYLIDLTNLKEFKKETRARMQAITKVIKERGYESGLKLVGTHYEDFQKATGLSKEDAKEKLVDCIGLKSIKDVNVDDVILIAELTDKNDIDQIIAQIIA